MQPERVGPYLIHRKLGAGGMGTVYFGHHVETDQQAAIKVLPASLAREEGFVARFNREIVALRKLKNPNVIELYESGVDGETYFYAMEYVDGETLAQLLRREKRLDWRRVVDLSLQICSALKAAHDAGIIHRDLKPSNLLISHDGRVKLTDFGIAQVFAGTRLTATGGIIGTAEYMSPEQAQGARVTRKSDLYSLGAVMYAMLTGRPPFSGKGALDVIHKHRYGQFERPSLLVPEIPHWLEEIVVKLLEKDPDKRFADAYVLFRRLQEVVRKVELSDQEETIGRARADEGTAPTVVVGGPAEVGGGTLMRDLLRAEIEHSARPSPLGQFFNSTWVLVALMLLVVAGGVLWFSRSGPDPQVRFDRGVALMNEPPGEAWLRARDEYFRPLMADDPETWAPQVQPFLDRIANYEAASDFWGRGRNQPRTEFQRFLNRARQFYETGDTAQAEQTLEALAALLAGRPEHAALYEQTQHVLAELRKQRESSGRLELLHTSMEHARSLAEQGKHDEARRVWAGIVELYQSDPAAQEEVEQARDQLSKKVTAKP